MPAQHWTKSFEVVVVFYSALFGAVAREADTREAVARQPPDLLENKTAANDTQAEILTWLVTKLSDGAGRVVHEAVACPVTHHIAREVCKI